MEDDKQEKKDNKLSYELLKAKCDEQDKVIASLADEINDLKAVIKANFNSNKEDDDSQKQVNVNKEEFEKRLKEGLGIC